ncbi:MAG: redox-sensing transcriptional repressor Rex [Clostridiaceae bacterium]|jgi:redox-sensing transcriptional repressor|nr:redox-sensing transcriptional repressor Rex [Clostridiaceae bacterium]
MDGNKKISIAVIKRLPRYYRYITELLENGITKVSSQELSRRMNLTASQIRQDLNCFGGFGQQGYGYNVEVLHKEIASILGIPDPFNVIIIGAGNMGQAIAKYENFKKRGFVFTGIFDINPNIIGQDINGVKVAHIDTLEDFVKENKTDIAVLCIPKENAMEIARRVAALGIQGLWNFSSTDLHNIEEEFGAVVENVHLTDNLMVLGYRITELRKNEKN